MDFNLILIGLDLGGHASKVYSRLWKHSSSKCIFAFANYQENDLPKIECPKKRDRENDQLKKCEPDFMTCEYHAEILQHYKNFRVVRGSSMYALL